MCIDQAIDTLLDTVDNVNVTLDNNMQNWVAPDAYQAPSLNERVHSKDVDESGNDISLQSTFLLHPGALDMNSGLATVESSLGVAPQDSGNIGVSPLKHFVLFDLI